MAMICKQTKYTSVQNQCLNQMNKELGILLLPKKKGLLVTERRVEYNNLQHFKHYIYL